MTGNRVLKTYMATIEIFYERIEKRRTCAHMDQIKAQYISLVLF